MYISEPKMYNTVHIWTSNVKHCTCSNLSMSRLIMMYNVHVRADIVLQCTIYISGQTKIKVSIWSQSNKTQTTWTVHEIWCRQSQKLPNYLYTITWRSDPIGGMNKSNHVLFYTLTPKAISCSQLSTNFNI